MLDYILERSIKALVFWLVGLLVLLAGAWAAGLLPHQTFPQVPADKWQAVFLDNGQVYFGKLTNESTEYVTLATVYYLRTAGDLERNDASINLIKLGGELHGPEDTLHIAKSQILFWENLKDTSSIVQRIQSTTR
jgi:hypothetical protein